ncbi:MAG: hypothetical protein IJC39_03390 [Firmicutes bacterium]|nr:hypothetical protein [Bacillota bacterium]
MPEILGATNPVSGYDNTITNQNLPVSPDNTQIKNIPDVNRVGRADGKTEQKENDLFGRSSDIRYDSNFQTFIQRLRESPSLAQSLSQIFAGKNGTVVLSGMSEGLALEMSKMMQMLQMDSKELLNFLSGQFKAGSRFGGALFALLRNAYARASSSGARADILQFLKVYTDFSSTAHLEGNIMRNLQGMADSMPASWADKLLELMAQLKNNMAAEDRTGSLNLLKQEIFPHMSSYVSQTHDMGLPRQLLGLLTLDLSRYENGTQENLIEAFHRLTSGHGTLKDQLGGISDEALLTLLSRNSFDKESAANVFADHLASAASHALSGKGDAATQQAFQQLVAAMLINESVYMPVNHFLLPIEFNGKFLFSELWVDPNAEDEEKEAKDRIQNTVKVLFKMDIQGLGMFDVLLTSRSREVNLNISCPDRVSVFSKQIEQALSQILENNGLTPASVTVRKMERPLTLTEVFPQIFERKNNINVKV